MPYNLPAVLGEKLISIVEGEKDCNRLTELGFVATCNPGGAGKWPKSFAKWFAGKLIAIFPDNDDAGLEHAEMVARSLAGQVSALKIVSLPGLPSKGDVSDWADAGGTADDLCNLIKAAPLWAPTAEQTEALEDDRPVVRVELGELHVAVAAANQVLADRSAGMFIGDLLVSLEQVDGGIQTIAATPTRIGLELARVARFKKVARVTESRPGVAPMRSAAETGCGHCR